MKKIILTFSFILIIVKPFMVFGEKSQSREEIYECINSNFKKERVIKNINILDKGEFKNLEGLREIEIRLKPNGQGGFQIISSFPF